MEFTNLALAYLIEELKPQVEGAFVNRIQEVNQQTIKVKLHSSAGSKTLIACPEAIYLTRYSIPARKNPRGFAAALDKALNNKKVVSLSQHESDRIAVLGFSECFLVFEFVSPGNIVLTDRNMKILACMYAQEWRDRTVKRNETYKFPAAKGKNPATVSIQDLAEMLAASSHDLIRALVRSLNIAPQLGEEACIVAGIQKSEPAKETASSAKKIAALHSAIANFYSMKEKSSPVLYSDGLLCPFPLKALASKSHKQCSTLNDCIDEGLSPAFAASESAAEKAKKATMLGREAFNLRQQQEAEEKFAKAAEENREKAELIYRHFPAFDELCKAAVELLKKGNSEEEVMYKLRSLASEKRFAGIKPVAIDVKAKKLAVEVS